MLSLHAALQSCSAVMQPAAAKPKRRGLLRSFHSRANAKRSAQAALRDAMAAISGAGSVWLRAMVWIRACGDAAQGFRPLNTDCTELNAGIICAMRKWRDRRARSFI